MASTGTILKELLSEVLRTTKEDSYSYAVEKRRKLTYRRKKGNIRANRIIQNYRFTKDLNNEENYRIPPDDSTVRFNFEREKYTCLFEHRFEQRSLSQTRWKMGRHQNGANYPRYWYYVSQQNLRCGERGRDKSSISCCFPYFKILYTLASVSVFSTLLSVQFFWC